MKLNLSPRCSGGWGCAREQQLYPCWTATLWGWMASCPSTCPAEPSLGNTWSLCRLGHTLSAELTAPYTEMLTLTHLPETLHCQPDPVIPDQSPGTACTA